MNEVRKQDFYFDEGEIALFDYLLVIWKWKYLIILIVGIAVLAAYVQVNYLRKPKPDIYQAKAVIKLTGGFAGGGTSSQIGGALGSVVQMTGISLPTNKGGSDVSIWFDSDTLKGKMIEEYNLLPILFPGRFNNKKNKPEISESARNNLKLQQQPIDKSAIWDGVKLLRGVLKLEAGKTPGTMEAIAEYHDPAIAVKLIQYYLATLNEQLSNEAKKTAEINQRFLEKKLKQTSDPVVQQKIYNMIAQEIETAMMSDMKENYGFKVIDPPRIPESPLPHEKPKTIMIALIASLFFSIFLSFFLDHVRKRKKAGKKSSTKSIDNSEIES